ESLQTICASIDRLSDGSYRNSIAKQIERRNTPISDEREDPNMEKKRDNLLAIRRPGNRTRTHF
ncbi:MAG: hypothetical protein MHMPM18_004217, partial [Marteilia pararefringens]